MFESILKTDLNLVKVTRSDLLKIVEKAAKMAEAQSDGQDIGSKEVTITHTFKGGELVAYTMLKELCDKTTIGSDQVIKECLGMAVVLAAKKASEDLLEALQK